MNAILEQINSTGKIFVEFALPMLVQSSVLILILLLTDFVLRKKVRAVFRYGIWLLVLVKLVLPTSLSAPLSLGYFFGDQLAYVDRTETTTETAQTAPAIVTPMIDSPRTEAGSDKSAIAPTTPTIEPVVAKPTNPPIVPVAPLSWQGAVFLAWLTVVLTMGLLLLQRAIFVRGLVAQAKEANSFMANTLESCCGAMGVKRKIGLKVSANATSPAVCGLFRPVILVPQNLTSSLNPSQLRAVLLHELAHIRRGDLWVNLAQTVLQIIYFYNPLLWIANCIIRRVREQAVDEMVLVAMGEKARQYPQTLVNVAKLAFKRPALSLRLIGVVESKSALTGRIKHILNRPMPKRAKLGILGLLVVIIIAAILLPMATCTPGPPGLVIKGTVKDAQTGEPIAGARVFDDGYGPKPNWEQIKADVRFEWGAITNSAGEYSFLTWPEHHSIKVEAPGYKAKRQSLYDGHFIFNKKDEEIFDFALEPEKVLKSSGFKKTLPMAKAQESEKTAVQVEGEGEKVGQLNSGAVEKGVYEISGTVYDPVPDTWWEDFFAKLEAVESEDEFGQILENVEDPRERPAAGVVVTLRGGSFTQETVTDAEGKYKFSGLPEGAYSLSCEKTVVSARTGRERAAVAKGDTQFNPPFSTSSHKVDLRLRDDYITVTGRITDTQGQPVAGAKVVGIQEINDPSNMHYPNMVSTRSGTDGSYKLLRLEPMSFYRAAGFLNGGDPTAHLGSLYLLVRVEADGFVQDKENVPRFPLITEEMLYWARRLLTTMSQLETRAKGSSELGEKEGLPAFPFSQGNTIPGIDIVLEPWPSGHVSGRVLDTKGNPVSNLVLEFSEVGNGTKPLPGSEYLPSRKPGNTTMDENGFFELPEVFPGKYSIIVYRPSPIGGDRNMQQVPVKGRLLQVEPGERVENFEIVLNPPEDYVISGHVRDAKGNPVRGLAVGTDSPQGRSWWTRTNDKGAFLIEGLDGIGQSFFKVNFGHGMAILDVPMNTKNLEFIVPDKGDIHGTVRNAKTGEAVTSYEVKVPVVNLSESGAVWEKPYVEIKRNPDDSFNISNVPAGEAIIEVSAEGLGVQRFVTMVETGKTNRLECKMPSPTIFEEQTNIDSKDFEVNIPNKTDDGGLDIVLEQTGTDVQVEGGKADNKAQIENAIRQLWTAIEANDIEKVAKLGPQGTFAYDNFDITNWVLKQAEEKKRILTERSRDLAEPDDIWIRGDEAIALKKMTRWYQDAHVYFFVRLPDGWTLYTMDTRLSMPTVNQDHLFRAWPRTSLDNKAWGEYSQAADLLHKGANRAELARRFSSIGRRYAITRKGRLCAELGILLARMVEKDKSFTEPADLQSLPTDEQINYYIFKLRDVAEQEVTVPGKCRVLFYPKTPNSPAVALRNMGRAVIPAMISLLDDRRPTRSVGVSENGGVVLRYCDVALEIIEAISGQKFDKRTERSAFLSTADETTRSGIISRAKARWHHKNEVQVEGEKAQLLIFHGLDLTAVPHTTNSSKLPDLFEQRPLGSKSYHIQKDVTAIYSGLDGTVYFIPRRNIFYVQHDKLGSGTLTYYGPFEGNPVQVLNLQPDVQVEGKKKKPVWLALLPRSPIRSAKELYLYFWGGPLVSDQTKIDSFELEIRSAKDNVRMARINGKRMVTVNTSKGEVLQWSMFRDGLRENMIRRIGPLEDGEYLIAIHVNGIRCSNVAKFTADSSFDSSNEPTLQVVPLVPAPGKKLQYFGLRAIGPAPQDPKFTNYALHFPDLIVDGELRKRPGRDWSGPVYPLKPGQQHEEILLLEYYRPAIDLSRGHTIKAIVGKYESASVEIGFDRSLGLAWDKATATIESRPPQRPALKGRIIGPDGNPGVGYRVRLYAGPRRNQFIEYSNEKGKYDFPNVPTGTYQLTCQPKGKNEPALEFEQFHINADQTKVAELSLQGRYTFSGNVTYEDSSPAAGVRIVGRWEIGQGNVFRDLKVTDGNGYYKLTAPVELAEYISLSIFTSDGVPAQGSYEHIRVMGSRTDVDFIVKRKEAHAAIWPEKFARMGGAHPGFQPVPVPEGWDYLRLLQALYKHLETQCKAKLPDCRATLKDEVIKLSFNTREYNIIRPGNAKRTGMRRNNDRGIGPEPDGLILTVHFSKTAGQFDRPYIIDRSPWTGFISQVYLPDIKLYLNVDIQYGTGINERLLTDLCAPTSWLKTIFNNFNERTLEQEAWGNAVEKDSQPDVQVDDGSNAPISEASKENKKPPEPNEPTYDGRSLTELIAALGDQDFQTRIKAVYHLGYMGPKAKPAVPALVGALDEERLRESVLHSLGNIGVGAEEAIPALIKAIAEYAPACRWMAAESLAKIGKAAVPPLKKAAGSQDIYLRIWCNAALAKQQGTDSPNLRYLAQLVKNADKRTAGEAVSALTMLGPISKPLVPDLIEAMKHSVVPKRHIASALARIGKDAGPAVPELTKMLKDTDLWTRADVISALSRIGGPDVALAVPLLIQALKTNDTSNTVMASRVRYTAATALGNVGPDARPAIPALVIALGDKDEFVRANSAKAIGDIDPTDMQAVPALLEAMKDESGRVRVAVAQTLLKIGPVNKEVILAFIETIDDNWKGMIIARDTFFTYLGPQHSYLIPDLIRILKTPNERAQRLAIMALGNMGEAAAPAVPYIIESMKNSRLEGIASGALRKLGPKVKAAVPELIKMLGDKRKRFSAALVLEAIGPQAREAIPALENCLGQSRFVLYARALLAINPKSEKAVQQLVRVAESAYVTDQWTEQPDAHYLLVKYGHEANRHIQALIDALENPNSRIRLSAAAYLGNLGAEANEAAESLGKALKDDDPQVRAMAARAVLLISLKPSERKEACNILFDLLDGKDFAGHDGLFMAQVRAAEALLSLGPLEQWTVPLLIAKVQDGSIRTRMAAIKAFGNIGPGAKEAIPYLKRLLKNEDWRIRHSAAQAIEKIDNKTDVPVEGE